MCGIFGIVQGNKQAISPSDLKSYIESLFLLSESRGKEASGMAVLTGDKLTINKNQISASEFVQHLNPNLFTPSPRVVIGHSRLVTNGHQADNDNNQPVTSGSTIIIHNGIIVNDKELATKHGVTTRHKVDTEVVAALVDRYKKHGYSQTESVQKTYSKIKGSASLAILIDTTNELTLATNTGSIFLIKYRDPNIVVFASERYILEKFTKNHGFPGSKYKTIVQVGAGFGININTHDLITTNFRLRITKIIKPFKQKSPKLFSIVHKNLNIKLNKKDLTYVPSLKNKIGLLKKHTPPFEAINSIRRCTQCILPQTMPFITFDSHGICNFCKLHKSVSHKGKDKLMRYVKSFRKRDKPDCIVALSGGRDSSYGLHFVKKVLKMNPIAYTYDWGMITDIARRNQARMVAELGVEHIIVSANIREKREHIRNHIKAWLKRPNLGMVPLFTAGDKQAEYYIEKLKEQTGIKLVIYCRGNELEDERFKFGHLGIFDGTPGGVIHNISLPDKIKISLYYLKQYLLNPSYINSSLWDTLFAYMSVYLMKHDFVYLWHYIPWREKEIIKTLKDKYAWETGKDTIATWRIDDGTPAFYNYIYYTVQGFTEHDALRSNQIREKVITRSDALALVQKENKPRYKSLKWYFDSVGLDGHKVLSIIDKIPKLYPLQ